jgi:drug/metabolite transporter (DMT)-like permease
MTHAAVLVSLKFFILALAKLWKHEISHELEKAGIILVVLGIGLMLLDSLFNHNYNTLTHSRISPVNFLRLVGDLFAITGSLLCAYLNQQYTAPKDPKFLSLFFRNLFISINFMCLGYYYGGNELSFDGFRGVFGLFDP